MIAESREKMRWDINAQYRFQIRKTKGETISEITG
jgi:hypothetical protein